MCYSCTKFSSTAAAIDASNMSSEKNHTGSQRDHRSSRNTHNAVQPRDDAPKVLERMLSEVLEEGMHNAIVPAQEEDASASFHEEDAAALATSKTNSKV